MCFILSVALSSNAMINAPAPYYCFQHKNEMRYFPFHIYDAGSLIAAPLLRKTTGFSACTPHRGLLELFLACSHICVAPWSNGVMAAGDAVALAASLAAASV